MSDNESFFETDIVTVPSTVDLSKILECPVCFDIPYENIILCGAGHSICKLCTERSIRCPVCESTYTEVRNLGLEAIISLLELECPFKSEGCKESRMGGLPMRTHVDDCHYRYISCTELSGGKCCDTIVLYSNYVSHLVQRHHVAASAPIDNKALIKRCIKLPCESDAKEFPYTLLKLDQLSFLEKCKITEDVVYWSVRVFGDKLTASQYDATLVLTRESKVTRSNARKVTWRIPVVSIRDAVDENSPQAAVYSLNDLMKFCIPKAQERVGISEFYWQLQVSVQKVEIESESDKSPPPLPIPKRKIKFGKGKGAKKSKKRKSSKVGRVDKKIEAVD